MGQTVEEKLDALLRHFERQGRSSSSSSESTKSSPMVFDSGGLLKQISGDLVSAIGNAKKSVLENQDMYNSLSKAGMGFRGDLFAMGNAAVGMRMSTKEMEEAFLSFQKDNILKGFGSNLTDSAEKFAKASKQFFDQNSATTDNLRRMGFTTKDINEVLALQGVTLRGKFKDDQEMAEVAANNANKLALEMDALSKLTGKSREEQAQMLKKQQADMQFEAAIRLKTQGMNAADAAAFEANARKEMHQAEMLGQGQMFKELFATGQIMSKEAATQAAINVEQANAVKKMAETAADKSLKESEREEKGRAARNELMSAQVKDLNDTTKLQMLTLGKAGGAYVETLTASSSKNLDMARTVEKVAAANNLDLSTKEGNAEAVKLANKEIADAAAGIKRNAKGEAEQVDGSIKAITAFQGRLGDASSVLNEKFVQPIQKEVNKELTNLANGLFNAQGNLGGLLKTAKDDTRTVYQKATGELDIGAGKSSFKDTSGFLQAAGKINEETQKAIRELIPKTKETVDSILKGIQQLIQTRIPKPEARQSGSLGMTGSLFENFGPGKLVELHGIESVMKPEQLESIMKHQMQGMLQAIPKSGVMDYEQLGKMAGTQQKEMSMMTEDIFKEINKLTDVQKNQMPASAEDIIKEVLLTGQSVSKNAASQIVAQMKSPVLANLDEQKRAAISGATAQAKSSTSSLDEQKRAAIMAGTPKTGNIDLTKMSDTVKTDVSSSILDKIDRKTLKFDQYGMPITSGIKEKAAEIPVELQKKEEAKKAETKTDVESMKQGIAAGKPAAPEPAKPEDKKPPATTTKESTLNDVVQALNQLNTKVSSLIEVQKDLGQRQIKATKANSRDVYSQ